MIETTDDRYIVFDGNLLPGISKTEVLERLRQLTGLSEEQLVEQVFSVKPIILKKTSQADLAQHFVASFEQAGLQVESLPSSRALKSIVEIDLPFTYSQETNAESELKKNLKKISLATAPEHQPEPIEEHCYRLIFDGKCAEHIAPETIFENLQHLTGATEKQVQEELFSVKPLIIIESSHMAVINEYQHAYSQAGLKLRLENPTLNPVRLFSTRLRIRRDKPETTVRKPPYLKALGITLFVGLASAGWIHIHSQWVSPFAREPSPKTIMVRLGGQPDKQIATNKQAKPKEAPLKTALPQPTTDLSKKTLVTPAPEKATKPSKNKPVVKNPTESDAQQTAAQQEQQLNKVQTQRQQYSNQLRLWLAQQQSSAPSPDRRAIGQQGMQGKVKLLINIARNGAIINAKVLSFTGSPELKAVALQDAGNASPYPEMPSHIVGPSFALEVMIRYQSTSNRSGE